MGFLLLLKNHQPLSEPSITSKDLGPGNFTYLCLNQLHSVTLNSGTKAGRICLDFSW